MMNNLRNARNFVLSLASLVLSLAAVVGLISALATGGNRAVSGASAPRIETRTAKNTMRSFGSEEELKNYFRQLTEEQRRAQARRAKSESAAPAPAANQAAATGLAKEADSTAAKDESITNTQHVGVDEGGIVKLHGDHLVVLRRGRLFTVAIGDNTLKPISSVDAFGPDIDPRYTWYDEMLVSSDNLTQWQ